MDNSKNWTKNKRAGNESSHSNKGRRGKGQQQKRPQNNFQRDRKERQFPKFVDNNVANNWQNNDWNCGSKNNNFNGAVAGPGIFPWIRTKPANPLIIPHHITFDHHNDYQEVPSTTQTANKKNESEPVEKHTTSQINDKEMNVHKSENSSVSANNNTSAPAVTNSLVKVKQEKDLLINLKKERKSSSSSSSSDSSSEEESKAKLKQPDPVRSEIAPSCPLPSSSLNIKLKPRTVPVNSPSVKTQKLEAVQESSSSSSSDESSSPHPPTPLKSAAMADRTEKMNVISKGVKTKSTKVKNSSEDDVVCMGNLENKIVLEDEDDDEELPEKNSNKIKKTSKKNTAEKCMICDKKGHTSFECQMICKNCSAPYHGYRTCPQPTNLNTMLQIFFEFCMQQFQSFNVEKQIATNPYDSVPKPQVDSMHLPSNKSNKLKRKQMKTNEINKKSKASKKRRISASKKTKPKSDSDDSSDDDNEEDDTDSKTSSTDSEEDISNSSAESLVSSKRKRKMKSKNASKAALNISNFSANPVNLPLVLNGFPHLTVPTASIPNTSSSTNALNTLLLTQMFQNAIGSLKK